MQPFFIGGTYRLGNQHSSIKMWSMRALSGVQLFFTFFTILVCTGNTIQLRGAGASFPWAVYSTWITQYKLQRSQISLNMPYDVTGSGTGKNRIKGLGGDPVEYAGSDSVLSPSDYVTYPNLQMFPTMAGAIVLGFKLPGVDHLSLRGDQLVGIYNGSIRWWNDTSLAKTNPGTVLPEKQICVLAREDKSGTTEVFTRALSTLSKSWGGQFDVFNSKLGWDPKVISYYGYTNRGMSGVLLSLPFCLGYLSVGEAKELGVSTATLFNREGFEVGANVTTVQYAMDNFAGLFDERLTLSLANAKGRLSYPISTYTYFIIYKHMENCDSSAALYRYIEWFLTNEKAAELCISKRMVPISKSVADLIFDRVLNMMTCGEGTLVATLVQDQKSEEARALETWRIPVYIGIPITAVVLLILAGYIVYQQYSINRAILRQDWRIPEEKINFIRTKNTNMLSLGSVASEGSPSVGKESLLTVSSKKNIRIAHFSNDIVTLTPIVIVPELSMLRHKAQKTLIWFRDAVNHINVVKFYGLTTAFSKSHVITGFCHKGTLQDVLYDEKYNLDDNFKFSISMDIAAGMNFLHNLGIIHGYLDTASCYIDSRWNAKVANWEFLLIAAQQNRPIPAIQPQFTDENMVTTDETVIANHRFWTAPERLRNATELPTKSSDVYSFGVTLVEIFSRKHPFDSYLLDKEPREIILAITLSGVRPRIGDDVPKTLIGLIIECWDPIPQTRPNFTHIEKSLKKGNPSKKGVVDCMMEAMEEYVQHLEEKVSERTTELNASMKNMESLLHKILPPSVAEALSQGRTVPPESFESVTVYFSDIVSFTKIASDSSPMEIVGLLNDLYTTFDDVIDKHDVYKVETIGDAYMCISGLPQRNGIKHVAHIANMALDLAIAANSFKIHHRPHDRLRIRMGMHTGSVVAGVVGIKMPRYCLFGDTVNTASRMESNSKPMNIHMTRESKEMLDVIGGYKIRTRGAVDIKGKGHMDTYWLIGREGITEGLPEELSREDSVQSMFAVDSLPNVAV